MDINYNSYPKAVQEAQNAELILQQAEEKVRLVNEAGERCQEEQKRLEQEKAWLVTTMKSVASEVAEFAVARERRIVLQVIFQLSLAFDQELTEGQEDLDVSVMMPEPLLALWKGKGPEVSSRIPWNSFQKLTL